MLIPSWLSVLHAARHNALNIVPRTATDTSCLPAQLLSTIPDCAVVCLQTFILNNYASKTCSETANLTLLCTTVTSSGLTIGEGSLQCVISNCPNPNIQLESGYTVCDAISGALPNTAQTITATINTMTSSTTSNVVTTTTSTAADTTSLITTIASSTLASTTSASNDGSTSLSSQTTTATNSADSSSSSNTPATTSALTTNDNSSGASSTGSQTASSSNGTAMAAAAPDAARKTELNTSAIAGIATGSFVVAALIVGYLAYLFVVKRKAKRRRRSQRFSAFFPPQDDKDISGASPPAASENSHGTQWPSPTARYYAGQPEETKRKSFWRRSFVPSSGVGVGVGVGVAAAAGRAVEPERPIAARISWPSPSQNGEPRGRSRWSMASSMDDDLEAQKQDLLILGSPRVRSSGRSLSPVKAPAPLRLSKVKPRAETPPSARLALTPVYDNGTFDQPIRQVSPDSGAAIIPTTVQPNHPRSTAPNFSRREPSLTRASQDQAVRISDVKPFRQMSTSRYPIKSIIVPRKRSDSMQSVSVYTDIEEDDTPEQEVDKKLEKPQANMAVPLGKLPLRDIRYPQIPASAVISKQAQKPHSPRAASTIRQVNPADDMQYQQPPPPRGTVRDRMVASRQSFLRTETSSSLEKASVSSESPVFPMPPTQTGKIGLPPPPKAQAKLARQISDAYKAASRPTTATSALKPSRPSFEQVSMPAPQTFARPGQMYQQIQRLSAGRPLAQKLTAQGFLPHPSQSRDANRTSPKTGSPPRTRTPANGDLYFTVPSMIYR